MISLILAILGAACVYAGIMMLNRDYLTGMAGIVVGIVLVSRPLLRGISYFRPVPNTGTRTGRQKGRRPKSHLKLVKSEDEKRPTIH